MPPDSGSDPSRPVMVGLTGAIAAGKSEALAAFERQGAATISSDAVVHGLLASDDVRDRLVERWGDDVAPGGNVDRERVGALVFGNPTELTWLEAQLHPLVSSRLLEWVGSLPGTCEVAVVEIPLLFETGMESGFDATVTVIAEDSVREARAGARGTDLVGERSGRQLSQDEKAALSSFVVPNHGSLDDLEAEVARLLPELVALGARRG